MKSVPDRLTELGDIYRERNKLYGDNYKHFGKVMLGMFPHGLTVTTEEDWMRLSLFMQAAAKLTRYSQSWKRGHADSLDDTAVYVQMLREVDDALGNG